MACDWRWVRSLLVLTIFGWAARGLGDPVSLRVQDGIPFVESADEPARLVVLENSEDLMAWQETCRARGRLFLYGDWEAGGRQHRFYRLTSRPLELADDWSNQLNPASGVLFTPGSGSGLAATRFAKFTLLLSAPDRVYFQDSILWPYHYLFARARLRGYGSISILEYNSQSLYANPNQRMVIGSVLRAPDPQVREVGIEIVGSEAFPVERTVDWVEAVKRRLVLEEGWRAFYMPSIEQRASAEAGRSLFEARGIALDELRRWAVENTGYSTGWALGRLVRVPGSEVAAALGDGRLDFGDILVTDRVPAELPVLAGYLALEPATPNSHVALLARSLLLPFAFAGGGGLQAEIASLYGRDVLLVVSETNGACTISLTDTAGLLTPQRRQEILNSKQGGAVKIAPKIHAGFFSCVADRLTPADVPHVGGKAANFGFLRRSLPASSPAPAIAFTFDLWDDYLSQMLSGGQTLRQQIEVRLASHRFPPKVDALRADLAAIRDLVANAADFNVPQRAAIASALQQAGLFGRQIRFRSSTNFEDLESFSGAGLYDSYSGCLEDDLDGDSQGPCGCDPFEPKERGVFRAIRKVFASFYNENAFLERLRYGIEESSVGMALLVHYSSPDEDEMANGVATLAVDKSGGDRMAATRIVTQVGAESVTNPDPAKQPEIVTADYGGLDLSSAVIRQVQPSSLDTNGAPVMTWEKDYRTLLDQLHAASLSYEQYYPAKNVFELDFEFKRLKPGAIGLKQIRAVPHPTPVPPPLIP